MSDLTIRDVMQRAYDHAKSKGFHDIDMNDRKTYNAVILSNSILAQFMYMMKNFERVRSGPDDLDVQMFDESSEKNRSELLIGVRMMLIISEVIEAVQELADGHSVNEVYYSEGGKPEGVPTEIADAIIRLLDSCYEYGIDISSVIEEKMKYNTTRPNMHGGRLF